MEELPDSYVDISLDGSMFAVLDTPNKTSSPDRATGQILALLGNFYEEVKYFRKVVGYDITGNKPPSSLHKWYEDSQGSQFANHSTFKYRLDQRWILSIKKLLFEDTLPIPWKELVEIWPQTAVNSSGGVDTYAFLVTANRRVSLKDVAREIENSQELEQYLAELPESSPPNVQEQVMKWGSAVWLLREFKDSSLSYQKIHELLPDDAPDRATLAVYYKRFLKAMERHKPRL